MESSVRELRPGRMLNLACVLLLMLTSIPQAWSMTSQGPDNSYLPSFTTPTPQPVHLVDPGTNPLRKIESKPVKPNQLFELTEKEGGGRHNNRSMNNNRNYPERSNVPQNGTGIKCKLSTADPEVYTTIKTMVESGAKLLEYDIDFPEYDINPLLVNMSNNFRASKWSRAFTKHGRTLLSLTFNYAQLSLTMLSFGVEKVKVELVDLPKGCFGKFNVDEKLHKIMEEVMSDFRSEIEDPQWVGDFDYACHEVIEDNDGHASFEYKCYERLEAGHRIHIRDNESTKWVNILFRLILVLKIIVFLVGPTVLSSSFQQFDYEVELSDPLFNSLLVTREHCKSKAGIKGELEYFRKFKKRIVDRIPEDEVQLISIRKLHIKVDHRRLMTAKSVPVGLLRFLYSNIVFCGLRRWEPFVSCCTQSIFGSWSPKFLWLPLRKEVNNHGKTFLKWKHIFRAFGGIFLLVCLPIPYYIRLVIFNVFEKAEIDARKIAIHKLGLHYPWEHTLIHYVDPTHPAMITLYCVYGLSFLILAIIRSTYSRVFEPVAMGAIRDMQRVKMMECFRLMVAHFVLPFEKCGICGLLVWIIYWPVAMVFSMIVTVCYCTPTLYLLGRFLIQSRTRLLRNFPKSTPPEYYDHTSEKIQTLTNGTSSFETCLLLENVSEGKKEITTESCWSCGTKQGKARFIKFLIGLSCCILMISVLILFVDVLGFAVEVFVFTMMGAIVNASKASKYVMLFFWIIIYASACFNNVYKRYMVLNGHVFKFIKEKLKDRIKNVTILTEETQKNVAFKFFNQDDLKDLQQKEMNATEDSEDEVDNIDVYFGNVTLKDDLTRKHLRLHWRIHNLVMFLDRYDIPHIPRDLFYDICDLEGPGYPGPVHRSLLEAFKQLGYMTLFLGFVIITVMTFGEAYKISSTNQLMVTLAGGFLPFVVRTVIKPKEASLDLNSYSFEAKLHQIIYKFSERWPVKDISFKVESKEEVTVMPTENGQRANGVSKRGPFDRPLIPFIDEAGSDGTVNGMNGNSGNYFRSTDTQTAYEDLIDAPPKPTSLQVASTQTPILNGGSQVDIKVDLTKERVLVDKERVQQWCSVRRGDLCRRGPKYHKLPREESDVPSETQISISEMTVEPCL